MRDWGNVLLNPGLGLYGAIVVAPAGAEFTDAATGEDLSLASSWRADVHLPDGSSYRDFALFLQDEDEVIGTHAMPYNHAVSGVVGLNYRSYAAGGEIRSVPQGVNGSIQGVSLPGPDGRALRPVSRPDDRARCRLLWRPVDSDSWRRMPETQYAVHVMVPFSEQNHVFSIEGHRWPFEPMMEGTNLISSAQVGAVGKLEIAFDAGGPSRMPGEYLYGDHRLPYREAGLWGLFRVLRPGDQDAALMPLGGR